MKMKFSIGVYATIQLGEVKTYIIGGRYPTK
jgi:hypothetical protein